MLAALILGTPTEAAELGCDDTVHHDEVPLDGWSKLGWVVWAGGVSKLDG